MQWLQGHTKDVRAVAYTPDGRLVSGGSDRTVRVWAPVAGTCLQTVRAPNVVYAVAVSPDGRVLAFAGRRAASAGIDSNTIKLWDLGAARPEGEYVWDLADARRFASCSIWSLAFSADGHYLAAACRTPGSANMLDGAGGHWWQRREPFADGTFPDRTTYAVGFAPAGTSVAVTRERAVDVLGVPGSPKRLIYRLTSVWAAAVVFIPPGDTLAIAANSFLCFADATAPRKLQRTRTGIRTVTALAVSPDGQTLLAGGSPGTVEVYDVPTRTRKVTFDFEVGRVHGLAFAPDGCTFAVGGDKGLLMCDAG
jgi:WD40 repeat protein